MWFHMGPNMHQRERVYIGTMTSYSLSLREKSGKFLANLSTAEGSNRTIGIVDEALQKIAKQRADLGAYYNRMEHAAKGLMNAYENVQASESRIRDADMAETMVSYTKDQILVMTGTAMLAQANMKPRTVLQLLGG
jgi:flagellin